MSELPEANKQRRCKGIKKWPIGSRCTCSASVGDFCKTHAPKSNGEDVRAGYAMGFEAGVAFEQSNRPTDSLGLIEALEFYADETRYYEYYKDHILRTTYINEDRGRRAREALSSKHYNGRPAVEGKPLELQSRDELLAYIREHNYEGDAAYHKNVAAQALNSSPSPDTAVLEEVLKAVEAAEELLIYDGYTAPQATAKAILVNALTKLNNMMKGK